MNYRIQLKINAGNREEFINITRRMVNDREFYNAGLKISQQLLTLFDKDIIREKLIRVYYNLLGNWQSTRNDHSFSELEVSVKTVSLSEKGF
jgi:hypothetical protein